MVEVAHFYDVSRNAMGSDYSPEQEKHENKNSTVTNTEEIQRNMIFYIYII
jgi:hypothetical protein